MEDVKAGDVSIDAISSVFSDYGFVQKISTFEKSAGFKVSESALIQYADIKTASSAKEALDGKSIPRQAICFYISSLICSSSSRIDFGDQLLDKS
ncbi:unnamed protein product [Sphenostylis stenocarpa]|uniref:RRM domain-containing protein n=1 Tax=Sphenostylis stenocarpa TaxID=92480 RepID=A0AA86SN49_9FABA|nr:unnamed protein product [Sphenostylis stenocarpa]